MSAITTRLKLISLDWLRLSMIGLAIGGLGWSPYVALAIFGISLIGVLYSAYLAYIELYVIYAICRWCSFGNYYGCHIRSFNIQFTQ